MPTEAHTRRRRLWARGSLIVAAASLAASGVIWLSHLVQYIVHGDVSHTLAATVVGVDHPLLQVALCVALPCIGIIALHIFLLSWVVGVHRGWKREQAHAGDMEQPATSPGQ